MIPTLKHLSYEDRLRKLNLPTLRYRRLRGEMIEIYKIMNEIYDPEVSQIFEKRMKSSTRGHQHKIYKRYARLNVRKNSFGFRNVDVWNNLSEAVVAAPSLPIFEKRLDKQWLNENFKFNHRASISNGFKPVATDLDIEAEP